MNIRIEFDHALPEDEIVILCRSMTEEVQQLQHTISTMVPFSQRLVLYKGDTEFYVLVDDILFFETESNRLSAHTKDNVYQTNYRLYELEELLPNYFLRVSKSTIVNVREIYSISRSSLSTTSVAAFSNTHKQVFVSRHYSKLLKEKLRKERLHK